MVKRKLSQIKCLDNESGHRFTCTEIDLLRGLLKWYDENQRLLPWRTKAKEEKDVDKRAYAVWVSEVMLQQTQVATVISYYNKWMEKWPTLQDLAKATLEEVNETWSGLGYYSRGQRLHQGANKVVNEMGGHMPRSVDALLSELPGVGRYTAGAIASIALGEVTGVVDGNVSRVFSRLRAIGADITSNTVTDHLWNLANTTVDPKRPGDFNQALMELGATVCTPRSPKCFSCPLQTICYAYSQVEKSKDESASKLLRNKKNSASTRSQLICDIEECNLCLPADEIYDASLGVMNFPRKAKKKQPREERTAVCVLQRRRLDDNNIEYLVTRRPDKGLLANLWEFPSILLPAEEMEKSNSILDKFLVTDFSIDESLLRSRKKVAEVVHIFSHIHQTYVVESLLLHGNQQFKYAGNSPIRWMTEGELATAALSTAMRKVYKAVHSLGDSKQAIGKRNISKLSSDGQKQLGLDAFFKKK